MSREVDDPLPGHGSPQGLFGGLRARQLRERQAFTKPSVKRRGAVLKAIYKQKIASGKIES